jgi:O-acetyl-ADP-ribose deacetylase
VIVGDLASVAADAVVRPTNGSLDAITPALRRLDAAAGPRFVEECRVRRELGVGAAVVTTAGDLAAELVVHAVIASSAEPVTAAGVRCAATAALHQAAQWRIGTLAVPPLGAGPGQLPFDQAAAVLLAALAEHGSATDHPASVVIVVSTDVEREAFEARLAGGGLLA